MSWKSVKTTARKELRSYFLSPVALIFLGIFLQVTLYIFFNQSKFFARNLADVRPLFSWLPLLMAFLVAALTMRQWSEEQKMGTLEVLFTLPIRTVDLVIGKFLAGMALVGVGLLLTLPIPISVSMMGPLDWGPVIGGYLAALLLASTYLAVGLCVSSRTDNQLVALLITALVCLGLYMLGHPSVTDLFGNFGAELLRSLGTGSRFASIERGVVDVRDLVYYGSLTAFFLALNVYFLESKRLDRAPRDNRSSGPALLTMVLLAGVNALALNLWLAPVNSARADLTADGEYSVSEATEGVLADLNEQLTLTGYFSERTHPLLAPLVPRIRDFLREYEVIGGEKIRVSFVDPNKDESVEEEVAEQYGIKSVPFQISGRHEESFVNSYFHVLVKYGDEYQVLGYEDLIEVHVDENGPIVRLRNLEYDLTRAIKKTTQGFQSIDAVLARSDKAAKLTAYVTRGTLPEEYKDVPDTVKKVAEELAAKSGGRFEYEEVDPSQDPTVKAMLSQKYGFRPMAVDLFGQETFYLHLLFQAGDHLERVFPEGGTAEADIRTAIEAAIKRGTPGFLKTVGIISQMNPGQPSPYGNQPDTPADFRALEQQLRADFQVKRVQGDDGTIPTDVDVLIVGKTGDLDEKQIFAIDQYLMRGGAVIALTGAYQIKPSQMGLGTAGTDDGLLDLLETYGLKVEQGFIMDPQNTRFPVPVREQRGGLTFQRVEMIPYPFFPDIRQEGFDQQHIALAGVPSLAPVWASPVRLKETLPDGVEAEVIVRTSDGSWLSKSTVLEPDLEKPEMGFAKPEDAKTEALPVAAVAVGTFPSHFADKPSPIFGEDSAEDSEVASEKDRTGRTIKSATPDARLAVVGSSEFVSDIVTQLSQQPGGGAYRGNTVFVRNLIDWAIEDTDLLQIRSAGAFARTLEPMEEKTRWTYEIANYLLALVALIAVLVIATTRRSMARPIPLTPEVKS